MPLRLWGIPVTPDDAHALVATLIADGSPDAVAAAGRISARLDRGGTGLVALAPAHRDAIPGLLEVSADDGPNELRGALIRDAEQRQASGT